MFIIRRTNIGVIYSMENKMNVNNSVVSYFWNKVFHYQTHQLIN